MKTWEEKNWGGPRGRLSGQKRKPPTPRRRGQGVTDSQSSY